jgi:DNA-binding winged helix-turn-helix (wHTH) protein/TolB-like protein
MATHDAITAYLFSGYRLDVRHKRLFNPAGEPVILSARPFDVLLMLVQCNGTIVSREELMDAVWPRLVVEEHNLTQAVSIVRKALDDTTTESQFVRTVPGRGYCFVAPVETLNGSPVSGKAAVPFVGLAKSAMPRLRPAASVLVALFVLMALAVLLPQVIAPVETAPSARIASPLGISAIPRPDSRIRNSIAVLPLANLSGQGDELFSVGLHDELSSRLAQIDGLNVIARSSVLTLLGQGLSIVEVTRVLRLESILSGTIRLEDRLARINLQLVDVRSGITLWTVIALNVGNALAAEIPRRTRADFSTLPPELAEAYRYDLAARRAHDRQDYAEEWRLALKSIELDPDFYDGMHTFASANLILALRPLPGMSGRQHAELASSYAKKLIELAPERSEGLALRAVTLAMHGNWAGAAADIAVLKETHAPLASLEYAARVALSLGDFETAIAIYEANLTSELLNPYGRGFLLAALELSGQRQQARRKHEAGQALHSQWWGNAVNVFLALGRGEAVTDVDQLVGISAELKQLLAQLDDEAAVASALSSVSGRPVQRPLEARFYAALAARSGRHDLAVEFLRTSMQHSWSSFFWAWLPVFDETRRHASFRTLVRESGLVEYWQAHGWPEMCQPAADDFRCEWQAYPAVPLERIASTSGKAGN